MTWPCSTDRSKAVVPVLVFLFVALWFILRGDLFYVLPCVIFSSVFQSFYEGPAKSFVTRFGLLHCYVLSKKGKRKVQGVPQSQTAALPRPQEEKETDKSKQAQIEQTYEKH